MYPLLLTIALCILSVVYAAENVWINVGGDDGMTVFDPPAVVADVGDTVIFNFTSGNHSVIQSNFTSPCVPFHDVNHTIFGFNSGPHDTLNGTSVQMYGVLIMDNSTIWFYDPVTCKDGGVGAININETTEQTLDGARNNAIRFNGTRHTSSSHSSGYHTSTARSPYETGRRPTSDAERSLVLGLSAAMPMVVAALALLG
ncbi:Le.flp1-like protein [Earliella scabrosa]|nr:Le.flp1-like protein [Earliella scabrosa]